MYIRQLFAVAALLLIGANSMLQPQVDSTPTATTAGVFGPPTGSSSGPSTESSSEPSTGGTGDKKEHGSWKDFMAHYGGHYGPPGFGHGGPWESSTATAEGTTPTQTATSTTDTTDTTKDTTDSTTNGTTDGTTSSAAASSAAPSETVTSGKLRRARAF